MVCKEVIILGSGATASEISSLKPYQIERLKSDQIDVEDLTQKGLLNAIFKSFILEDKKNELVDEWKLRKFFDDFWQITPNNFKYQQFPSIEDWLGIMEWARYKKIPLFGYDSAALFIRQNCILDLIAQLLKILETPLFEHPIHSNLISRLLHEKTLFNTAFISFNWESIIDITLKKFKLPINYGISFSGHSQVDPFTAVLLLKLHGSLDWIYCPNGNHLFFKDDITDIKPRHHCPLCNIKKEFSPLERPIIPPTFSKIELMDAPFIHSLFERAVECLKSAESVYFCGYSIPAADMDFKYLIKRVESERGDFPGVYICNGKIDQREITRIKAVFKNKDKVQNTNLSFEAFVNLSRLKFFEKFKQ